MVEHPRSVIPRQTQTETQCYVSIALSVSYTSSPDQSYFSSTNQCYVSDQCHISAAAWARFLTLAQSKLRLCSANHRAGYFSNLACDWLSIVWAYSEQGTENGSWSVKISVQISVVFQQRRSVSYNLRSHGESYLSSVNVISQRPKSVSYLSSWDQSYLSSPDQCNLGSLDQCYVLLVYQCQLRSVSYLCSQDQCNLSRSYQCFTSAA